MPSERNQRMLKNFEKALEKHRDFFITENQGLNVVDLTELRNKLKEQGAVCQVVKNRLIKIALQRKNIVDLDKIFIGPNMVLLGDNPVEIAKILSDFVKVRKDKLKVKGGISGGKAVDAEYIKELGLIGSREELILRFLRVLTSPVQKLTLALNEIKEKKQEQEV